MRWETSAKGTSAKGRRHNVAKLDVTHKNAATRVSLVNSSIGSNPKMAERLAREIEMRVISEGWPVGKSIGSEPELIAMYGVSRAVFREAVRLVEHDGVAVMRRGAKGGLFVTAPDLDAVEHAAMLYLDHADVSPEEFFEVRRALELLCTSIVAETVDEEGIEKLRAVVEHERESLEHAEDASAESELHVMVAELTGNAALRLFVETLARVTHHRVGLQKITMEEHKEAHRAHVAIVDAIITGDVALAQHRMSRHLAAVANYHHRRKDGGTKTRGKRSASRSRADGK